MARGGVAGGAAGYPLLRAEVVEIGCGPLGGFVPMLRSSGYKALGVDPEAPDGERYRHVEFERPSSYETSTPSSRRPRSITWPIPPRSSTA